MKKLALAALVALGAGTLLTTPLDAKGGGGGGHGFSGHASFRAIPRANIGPLARRGHPVAYNIGPLAYRQAYRGHFGGHHHHGHHRRYDYGYGDYAYGYYPYDDYPYDYAYADRLIPDNTDDQPTPPPHIVTPVIRTVENSKDVCKSEAVKVPASSGGDATVTILRC